VLKTSKDSLPAEILNTKLHTNKKKEARASLKQQVSLDVTKRNIANN